MKLKEYMKKNGINQQEAAVALGVSKMAVNRYINGRRRPQPEIMFKIQDWSNREVTAVDFFYEKTGETNEKNISETD